MRDTNRTNSSRESTAYPYDPARIKPQWFHPYFRQLPQRTLTKTDLEAFAYDYYLRFLPLFKNQAEGSINPGVIIEFTRRMKQKLGLAYLFEHRIKLNENYFAKDPRLLPYTLFHEMIHLWLYDCLYDPGHTRRFYNKMAEFTKTGLPVDPDVHIHSRVAVEGKIIYCCPNCNNRWYLREKLRHAIYCGHCYDRTGAQHYARLMDLPSGHPLNTRRVAGPETAA